MTRRDFLRRLGLGAAVVATGGLIDAERLLWTPGEKTIFVPPATGWLTSHGGNSFLTIEMITHEALKALEHQLTFGNLFNPPSDVALRFHARYNFAVEQWADTRRAIVGDLSYARNDRWSDVVRQQRAQLLGHGWRRA